MTEVRHFILLLQVGVCGSYFGYDGAVQGPCASGGDICSVDGDMVGIYTIHVRDYAVAGAWQPLTVVKELLGVHTSNIGKM